MAATVVSGAAFGAALAAAGIYQPSVILSQLQFGSWAMMQTFLTATACSVCAVSAAQHLHLISQPARGFSRLGLGVWPSAPPWVGNLAGGLLLGAGMALAGACPGTALAQAALGLRSGYLALAGGLLGGVFWSGWLRPRIGGGAGPSCSPEPVTAAQGEEDDEVGGEGGSEGGSEKKAASAPVLPLPQPRPRPGAPALAIHVALGISPAAALLGFEALCAAALAGITYSSRNDSNNGLVGPIAGGLLIAAAQLLSMLLRGGALLGTSAGYEQAADALLGTGNKGGGRSALLFCASVAAGARGLALASAHVAGQVARARALQATAAATIGGGGGGGGNSDGGLLGSVMLTPSPLAAVVGGFLMVVGSRLGGGCPSGHISGLSLMSVSSAVTICAAFGFGAVVRMALS